MSSENLDVIERTISGSLLLCVVIMQALATFVQIVQGGTGRYGRALYFVSFVITLIHEMFTGIIVPGSLVWAAAQLLGSKRSIDSLLAAVVGALWYGPDRVQKALQNLWWVRRRLNLLQASLSSYHRAAVISDHYERPLSIPMKVTRRLRLLPWWNKAERNACKWWHGRVTAEGPGWVNVSDKQIRVVARMGIQMSLAGDCEEERVREWCVAVVADQSRFVGGILDRMPEYDRYDLVFEGLEGRRYRSIIDEHGKTWTVDELRQLASVIAGIRKNGLFYIKSKGWVA